MTKNERTSMFNEAQMRDRAEKEAAIQNQETAKKKKPQAAKEEEKQLVVRLPYTLWRQLMMRKIETGDSMNTSILKSLREYLRDE